MKTIKFGIVGCGLMGREFASAAARWCHLSEMAARPQIVHVCDPNHDATDWFTGNAGVERASADYRELLADPQVEAVYCAVPHDRHEELYAAILQSGKHLLAEKPFGIDLAAAHRIQEAVERQPELLVRCSSEFPFYPAAQRIAGMVADGAFGRVIEVKASFCHSSDLDPNKPINWKRRNATNGEYGCMGDLGLHVLHLPLRLGFTPRNVRAVLTKVVDQRPDGHGGMAPCETWDNAMLACEGPDAIPMLFETKRISPGDTNNWSLRIVGTQNSAEFSTRYPKSLRTMPYTSGGRQAWAEEEVGYEAAYPAITGKIFEFGFPDAIQQMVAAFCDELAGKVPKFQCATPEEAVASHRLFTAALESHRTGVTVAVG